MSGQEGLAGQDGPAGQDEPAREAAEAAAEAGGEDGARRIAELDDAWRRTAAELDNVRKRCVKDVARAREQERATATSRWLPVLDNLERALEHAASDPRDIVEGVRSVLQQALGVLADVGYPRRDDEVGTPFDPFRHEAVGTVVDVDIVPGTIARVLRPGYGTDEETLRPASVIVATRSP